MTGVTVESRQFPIMPGESRVRVYYCCQFPISVAYIGNCLSFPSLLVYSSDCLPDGRLGKHGRDA